MTNSNYTKPQVLIQRWFNSRTTNVGVSLTKGKTPKSKSTDYFAFINCVEIDQDSGQTTGNMISLKATFEDVCSFEHAIRLIVSGRKHLASRFRISSSPYTVEKGERKTLSIREEVLKDSEERFLILFFREGDSSEFKHVLDPTRALALADYLHFIAQNGLLLVMNEGVGFDKGPSKSLQHTSSTKQESDGKFNPDLFFGS
ncbi:hypothetical protein Dalk_1310 [Desulfatibacillum aliphaticivorans]|uniref:Uncharacterized protein n=1 Tax=Desulfatibacillum aliphaticivorans TaxID=218208 RepID=B8F9R7_DESAL|nr:hypothetical protein [Desulfatibacillum aliphaticivorans]ACL03013.1 hypothetical protein Dalk_1310 [Desulfatibacillum aliphaticivorans]